MRQQGLFLASTRILQENEMKTNWVKWCLLLGGSTVAALQLGSCVRNIFSLAFDSLILAAVN
jgi:hypothetical protein